MALSYVEEVNYIDFISISFITLTCSFSGQAALHDHSPWCGSDVGAVAPCTHEEADTQIFLHVAADTFAGHRRVIIHTSDSDFVVLGVCTFVTLKQRIDNLWIAFGMRHHFRFIKLCM